VGGRAGGLVDDQHAGRGRGGATARHRQPPGGRSRPRRRPRLDRTLGRESGGAACPPPPSRAATAPTSTAPRDRRDARQAPSGRACRPAATSATSAVRTRSIRLSVASPPAPASASSSCGDVGVHERDVGHEADPVERAAEQAELAERPGVEQPSVSARRGRSRPASSRAPSSSALGSVEAYPNRPVSVTSPTYRQVAIAPVRGTPSRSSSSATSCTVAARGRCHQAQVAERHRRVVVEHDRRHARRDVAGRRSEPVRTGRVDGDEQRDLLGPGQGVARDEASSPAAARATRGPAAGARRRSARCGRRAPAGRGAARGRCRARHRRAGRGRP
jgi:hypothetical protein